MTQLTDLEMTQLCAAAMEPKPELPGSSDIWGVSITYHRHGDKTINHFLRNTYDPLHDDAQAMELVKRFYLTIGTTDDRPKRRAVGFGGSWWYDESLNRAIVLCVANMQASKKAAA